MCWFYPSATGLWMPPQPDLFYQLTLLSTSRGSVKRICMSSMTHTAIFNCMLRKKNVACVIFLYASN